MCGKTYRAFKLLQASSFRGRDSFSRRPKFARLRPPMGLHLLPCIASEWSSVAVGRLYLALTIPVHPRKNGGRGPWFTSVPLPPLIRPVRPAIKGNMYGERETTAAATNRKRRTTRQRFNLQIGSILCPAISGGSVLFHLLHLLLASLHSCLHSGAGSLSHSPSPLSRSFLVLRLIDFRLSGTPPTPPPPPPPPSSAERAHLAAPSVRPTATSTS